MKKKPTTIDEALDRADQLRQRARKLEREAYELEREWTGLHHGQIPNVRDFVAFFRKMRGQI